MRKILSFFNQYSNLKRKANEIKLDPDRREKSIHFGITSILTSFFAVAFCILGCWILQAFSDSGLFLFTLVIGIGIILCGAILFIWSLIRMIFQFKINKSWASWLSLLLFLGCIFASMVGIAIILSN